MHRIRADLEPGHPPRLASTLLRLSAPAAERDAMLGDLEEEHALRARRQGSRVAAHWYWSQTLASLPVNLWRRARHALRVSRLLWRDSSMTQVLQDVRYTLREYARRPGFALLVIGTLALGIAANTAIFSAVDFVLFDPYPYPEPKRLVGVGPEYPKLGRELSFWEVLSPAEIEDVRAQSRTLEEIVAWDMGHRTLAGEEAPENVFSAFWWGNALPTLGVEAAHGRGFLPEETANGAKVAVISHRLFERRFGGDPRIVGDTLLVNGDPYTVVGVLPPRTLIYGTDLWIPMGARPEVFPRNRRQFQLLARIADGYSLADVDTELETIAGRIAAEWGDEHEEYQGWGLRAMTWNAINVRLLRPMALVLVGAIAFVLLLVCANVANLLLGRSAGRRQEIAVRQALGAGRSRIVRQLLTESVLLAVVGGGLGIALSVLGIRGLAAAVSQFRLPLPADIALNGRVLLISALVSVAVGLLFGLAPALQASQRGLGGGLGSGETRGTVGRPRQRLQQTLVAVQVALAVILLFGGGLLLHSLIRLQRVDPGFRTENLLTFRITLPWERFDQPAIGDFFRHLTEQLEARPEVRSAAVTSQLPSLLFSARRLAIEGMPAASDGSLPTAFVTAASPGFFRTFDMPLLRGRTFTEGDVAGATLVTVINQAAADRYFPDRDPIGQRIRVGGAGEENPLVEVVGVVAAGHNAGNDRPPAPEIFGSVRQGLGGNQLFVAVESAIAPTTLLETVREEVKALDPQVAIYAVQTMDDLVAADTLPRRMVVQLLLVLGAFALALAGVGVYAVVSFAVAQRTREIGVRMALGAGRGEVRRWVVRQALRPVVIGGLLGLLGAAGVARGLGGMLFEVSGFDPMTLVGAVALLVLIAIAASLPPALRASGVDPAVTLRDG
ncbi:MAG TPA: ADOP family duplicated permease [Thermoanaerobaculia bacterium]|nr:ADOP family duplicated permease [Thermoanaerobaculia bacterium]